MRRNVGTVDRIVRALIGIVVIVLGLVYGSWWGAIGVIPLATAVVSFCPLYRLLGISTCSRREARPDQP